MITTLPLSGTNMLRQGPHYRERIRLARLLYNAERILLYSGGVVVLTIWKRAKAGSRRSRKMELCKRGAPGRTRGVYTLRLRR
jgi:hypothetical protein